MKHADVIATLSLLEKYALLSGSTVFETHALPGRGIPAIWLSDGPNDHVEGVREGSTLEMPTSGFGSAKRLM